MIPQYKILEVSDAARIEEVVGDHLQLMRAGTSYKCCCPFHQEDTPSFTVSPGRNTFHCFGCGKHGSPIDFVMEYEHKTFPEAVKALADKYHIEVKEEKLSREEEDARKEREQLFVTNKVVAEAYHAEFLRSKEAQDYAYSRWGKDYCEKTGIGYAPEHGRFVEQLPVSYHAKTLLNLLNGAGHDMFRHRITIPIRDRFNQVLGFTCRTLDASCPAKYMNSSESPIYKKRDTLFGVDVAAFPARDRNKMYAVEGAPDCMRLHIIGAENAVAPLGTAWTDEQFKLVARSTKTLCFIPDADPPKQGEQHGAGVKGVIKNGRRAVELGFNVLVKQIPVSEVKQDPDTYFTDLDKFQQTEEQEFILWYAEILFEHAYTAQEKADAMGSVSALLVYIADPAVVEDYIDSLQKLYGGKRTWKTAVQTRKAAKEEEQKRQAKPADADDMDQRYGFHIENNCYFSMTDSGSVSQWSNFILKPRYLIEDAANTQRLFVISNNRGQSRQIALDPGDLVSLQLFSTKVESLGNFIWKASSKELIKLKTYLFEETLSATPVKQLGWNRRAEFFAFGNGIVNNGVFIETDDDGIVNLDKKGIFYIAANAKPNRLDNLHFQFEHQFVHDTVSGVSLQQFVKQLFLVYKDNGRVAFSFLLTTLFRDIVVRETGKFPILNLFGPKGSGKSDLAQVIMSFFNRQSKGASLTHTTVPALGQIIAGVSCACVHLDEYKNDLSPTKIEILKGLWDGVGRARMNMDKSGKMEVTAVDCGAILSGQEMPTADIALYSRLVHLSFPTSEFTSEEKQEHKKLMMMASQGLSHLTIELLRHRDHVERFYSTNYAETFTNVSRELEEFQIEDRILKNWVMVLAMYRTMETLLPLEMSYKELYRISVAGIRSQNRETKTTNEIGKFWKSVAFLVGDGDLIEDGDFRITSEAALRVKDHLFEWKEPHDILSLQKTRVFMLYKMREKQAGDAVIPEESLRYYLEHSKAYLGEKNVRFKVFKKGQPVYVQDGSSGGKAKQKSQVQLSYIFDYNILKSMYAINLGKRGISIEVDAEEDSEDKPF